MHTFKDSRALVFTALAPLLWSTGGLGVRLLEISPWAILFWRSFFMTITLLIWSLHKMRGAFLFSFRKGLAEGWPVTVFTSLSFIFYVFSVTNTSVADSLLIQGTAPIFIVLAGWLILHEPLKKITIASLFLVIIGIAIIMLPSLRRGGLNGNLFGLAKALVFALSTIFIRSRKSVGLLPATTFAGIVSMLIAFPMVQDFHLDPASLLIVMYLGVFQIGIGFILFVTWSGKLRSSQTGLLVILEAVLGPIWPWLVIGERPYPLTFVGGAVIITALVLHTIMYPRAVIPERRISRP